MSARAIVSGALGKPAEIRTSKNGNPFATFSLRESLNGSTRWWQCICFTETRFDDLKELAAGEPIAVAGAIDAEIYAPAGAESRINWRVTVDAVLSARRKPKDKPATALTGRGIANKSWAAPQRGDAGDSPF